MISASILGASGYTGQELVRLLGVHPQFQLKSAFSVSPRYNSLVDIRPVFPDIKIYPFDETVDLSDVDVWFLAIPHGESHRYVERLLTRFSALKIVDLSADFRLKDVALYKSVYGFNHESEALLKEAVMGIAEIYKDQLKETRLCANPGCYAIAASLGLWPLRDVLDDSLIIDAKSGASGAGRSLKESSLFVEVNESISAYKTGVHRHQVEIAQNLGLKHVFFSPHLLAQDRGILCSMYLNNTHKISEKELIERFKTFYNDAPFVLINESDQISTKELVGTNSCVISLKVVNDKIIVFTAIDNLIKGASGVAIQNANIMFGLDESLGLRKY